MSYWGAVKCNVSDVHFQMFQAGDDCGVAKRFHDKGCFERKTMELWLEHANEAKVIADVGAHTGAYSIVAHTGAEVWSYEPYYMNFARLTLNMRLNQLKTDHCRMMAIGDKQRQVNFAVPENPNYLWSGGRVSNKGRVQVDMNRLDNLHKKIDLVKIDVEGLEGKVLKGAQRIIEECKPTVFFECIDEESAKEVQQYLQGYSFYKINDNSGKVTKVDELKPELINGKVNMDELNRLAVCK